jgi:hypothetical protein
MLQVLFVLNAKALLLVDDHEAEIGKRDAILHVGLRTIDYINRAFLLGFSESYTTACGAETTQDGNANGEPGHTFGKGPEVLLG